MTPSQFARFLAKVEHASGACWTWTAAKCSRGYGRFACGGKPRLAHRVSYEHFVGEIREGTEIDHLCRNKSCVNPTHLEAVAHVVNVRRAWTTAARALARTRGETRTHCERGHTLPGNRYFIRRHNGVVLRLCRTCALMRQKTYRDQAVSEGESRV